MKRYLLLLLVFCCTMTVLAQNDKISYQAVVRDSENHLVYSTPLQVTVALANSETGMAVYRELHNVTSNANGLVSLLIGAGDEVFPGSDWNAIHWSTAWVTATIRKASDQTFLAEHHLPLSAVPYALYADFADSVNLQVLQDYLDEHHYVTESDLPTVEQSDWEEDDEESPAFIKNKPNLSVYATNAHLNDTLSYYATTNALKDSLSRYVDNKKLNDTLDAYYTKDNVDVKLNEYEKKSELCGDVKDCIKDTLKYYTTSDQIDTLLGAYYDTTHVKTAIHDTADVLRNMMVDAANDGQLTIIAVGDTTRFTANQATNDTVWLNKFATKDTLAAYYDTTHTQSVISDTATALRAMMGEAANDGQLTIIAAGDTTRFTANQATNDTVRLNKFATKDTLAAYTTIDALKDSLTHYVSKAKLNDTLSKYTTTDKIDTIVNKHHFLTSDSALIVRMRDSIQKVNAHVSADSLVLAEKIRQDSIDLAKHISDSTRMVFDTLHTYYATKDTLKNFLTINGLCDSVMKCEGIKALQTADNNLSDRIKADSLNLLNFKTKVHDDSVTITSKIRSDSSTVHGALVDSLKHYLDSTQVVRSIHDSIGNGKLSITYGSNTPVIFKANQKGNSEITIPAPAAPNNGAITIKRNGESIANGTFNVDQSAEQTIDISVPTKISDLTNDSKFADTTTNNHFTGKNTFSDTNYVEKRGFSFDTPGKTTESNCQVMVNACDLLAVFDSLAKRMDNLSKRFDSLQKSNDSLAEELDSLKKSTMPSLALSSDKPSDTCVVEGSMVEITYKATLLRTDGTFNYKWYVNGAFLREGATKDTIHLTTDTAGVIKVKCVATATSGHTELKDSLTTTIGIKLVFDYTILGGNSADFGRIRIDSSTAISAVWKDEDGNEIGTWNSGLTETLPVGEYTVVLSGRCEPDTVKIDVLASPMCLVGSLNETETIGSYTFNVEEGVTKYGRQYVTQIYDLEENLYNVVDIGGVCWTRENMRSTIYSKNSKFYPIYDGLSDYTHGPNAPYLFEKSDPQINGYLYTKSAAAAGVYSYPTDYNAYIRGICPDGWHLPSYNDVSVMLDATGARSNAGKLAGALTSAADTSWTECNTVTSATGNYDYAERNSTGFSAIRSGYIDASYLDTEPFNDDGAYFWVSRQHDNTNYPTWYSFVLRIPDGCSKDIDFGEDSFASDIYNALSVRCVRDMQPSLSISSSEGNNVSSCGSLSVPVTFTAKIHNDDADGYQYSWNGAAATSSNTFSASYSSSGNYTVSCTATKGEMTLTATYKIKVGCVGIDTCIYNLTVTVVGTMGSPTTIDWGDGQTTNGVAVNSTFHTYGTAGTYNIQVSDNDGNVETLTATVSKPHTTCNLADITTSNAAALANEYSSSAGIIDSVSDHEGNWYEVVRIGSQCWLKENMRCTTSPSTPNKYIVYKPTSADDHTVILSYVSKIAHWYNNDSTFYAPKDYGLLYNWCAAMDTFNTAYPEVATQSSEEGAWECTFNGNRRGICPAGWHVPTTEEWTEMESLVNGEDLNAYYIAGIERGSHAGKLSSSCDWNDMYSDGHGPAKPQSPGDYGNPNRNISGFSALPAGTWNGKNGGMFENAATANGHDGSYAMFWTSTNDTPSNNPLIRGIQRRIVNSVSEVQIYNYDKYHGHSVRCVRD